MTFCVVTAEHEGHHIGDLFVPTVTTDWKETWFREAEAVDLVDYIRTQDVIEPRDLAVFLDLFARTGVDPDPEEETDLWELAEKAANLLGRSIY